MEGVLHLHEKDDVAMGSPVSPVMANYFIKKLKQVALRSAPRRPLVGWDR